MASSTNRGYQNRIRANNSNKDGRTSRNSGKSAFGALEILKKAKNLVFFVVIAYMIFSIISQQSSISKNNSDITLLRQQISEKEIEIERLQQEYSNIDSDEYVERMAREKLGLVQANERVFRDSSKRQ